STLHDVFSRPDNRRCPVRIVRYQLPYAENFADDLKPILVVADIPFEERFATTQLPKGLSIRFPHSGPLPNCGAHLVNSLRTIGQFRGASWNIDWREIELEKLPA